MRYFSILLAFIMLINLPNLSYAATLAVYEEASGPTDSAAINASEITLGDGLSNPITIGDRFGAGDWTSITQSEALANGEFIEFTVFGDALNPFSLTLIEITAGRGTGGPSR